MPGRARVSRTPGSKGGFGGTLTSIGIVIVAETIMGTILEKTSAALAKESGYFWGVSQFSGMPENTAYKACSSATAVEGTVAFFRGIRHVVLRLAWTNEQPFRG
jgi:H+/gluconate symporter-like permease